MILRHQTLWRDSFDAKHHVVKISRMTLFLIESFCEQGWAISKNHCSKRKHADSASHIVEAASPVDTHERNSKLGDFPPSNFVSLTRGAQKRQTNRCLRRKTEDGASCNRVKRSKHKRNRSPEKD